MPDKDSGGHTPLYRYRFGAAEFDESRGELYVGGLQVDIEQRPLQVLSLLLSRVDQVVTRQELFDLVWEGRVTVDNVIYNAFNKLRKALKDEGGDRIVTIPRVGYKLVGPVERIAVGRQLASRLELKVDDSVPGRDDELSAAHATEVRLAAAQRNANRMRAWRPWVIAAMSVLIGGLAVSLWLYVGQRRALLEADAEHRRADQINRFLSEDLLGAENDLSAAVDLLTASRGAADSLSLDAQYSLISVFVQTNRLDEASTRLDAADRLAGKRLHENSTLAYRAHWAHASLYKLRRAPDKALVEYAAADAVRAAIYPDDASLRVRLRDALSWCYARLGRNADAIAILRDVVTPAYTPERVGPVLWAQAHIDYGIAQIAAGNNALAEQTLSEALAHQLGLASPQAERAAYYLARALTRAHRVRDSAALLPPLTAADLEAAEPRGDWSVRLEALRGETLLAQGRTREGLAALSHAVDAMGKLTPPDEDLADFRRELDAANGHR